MSDDSREIICAECGIVFSFSNKIGELWRKSKKTFFCPNGHSLLWNEEKESLEQKELIALRSEVKSLKDQLTIALSDAETQKKRADELATELEIWKPSTVEKISGVTNGCY